MALAAAALAACGGGGGGASPAATETPASVVSGAVVKGPVASATVCAFELLPTGKGKGLACTLSGEDGSYSLSLDYTGPVIVEASGGHYTDEASGNSGVSLDVPLTVAGTVAPGTQTLVATPLTAMAYARALRSGALTVAGFDAAAADVQRTFFNFAFPGDAPSLGRMMPVVSGQQNGYGYVLSKISVMLGKGATLSGIINSTDLAAVGQGYNRVRMMMCAGDLVASTMQPSVPDPTVTAGPVTSTPQVSVTVSIPPDTTAHYPSCQLAADGTLLPG